MSDVVSTALPHSIGIKEHIEEYEELRRLAHRTFLITCVIALCLLGVARNSKLLFNKASQGGFEIAPNEGGIPASSYAVVLGPPIIAILLCSCYRSFSRACGLRTSVCKVYPSLLPPEAERLCLPLLLSEEEGKQSWVAWLIGRLTAFASGVIPLVCGGMLLWDYSHKFEFDPSHGRERFNEPFSLWITSANDQVIRPNRFDGFSSNFHPALLPWWQPWLYLLLLIVSVWLVCDIYRRLGLVSWCYGVYRFASCAINRGWRSWSSLGT